MVRKISIYALVIVLGGIAGFAAARLALFLMSVG
jgi:hypothetical protein